VITKKGAGDRGREEDLCEFTESDLLRSLTSITIITIVYLINTMRFVYCLLEVLYNIVDGYKFNNNHR